MTQRILAITQDDFGTSRVYLGGAGGPGTLVQTFQEYGSFVRSSINKEAPFKHAVGSTTHIKVSIDNGTSWFSTGILGNTTLRSLSWVGQQGIVAATGTEIFYSSNNGLNFFPVPLSADFASRVIKDVLWGDSLLGFAILSDAANSESFLLNTQNGGVSWDIQRFNDLPGWALEEAPRRIVRSNPFLSEVILLTSHSVWSISFDGLFNITSSSKLWDHDTAVSSQFPFITSLTGYDSGVDHNTRFDDLMYFGGPQPRIWVAGYSSLRATTVGGVFSFIDVDAVQEGPEYYTHSHISSTVFSGSTRASTDLYPFRPGLNISQNWGLDSSSFKTFPGERLIHHDSSAASGLSSGCSDPRACDYIDPLDPSYEGPVFQHSACSYAVILTDCHDGSIIHTGNPECFNLRCKGPSINFNIIEVGTSGLQQLELLLGGISVASFSFYIESWMSPSGRVDALRGQLVASFNDSFGSVGFCSVRPDGSIDLELHDTSSSGTSVVFNSTGFFMSSDSEVQAAVSGSVVSLEEFPGRCFHVCGMGSCSLLQDVTVSLVNVSCSTCLQEPEYGICMDCGSGVFVNSNPLQPNGTIDQANCVAAGDRIDFYLRAEFPFKEGDCPCEAVTLVSKYDASTQLLDVVFEQRTPCVSRNISNNFSFEMPSSGIYHISITASDCDTEKVCEYWVKACEPIRVVNKSCHKYLLQPEGSWADGPVQALDFKVEDLGNNSEVLVQETLTTSSLPIELITDHDSIYKVTIELASGTKWTEYIIDLCDLKKCRLKLSMDLLCDDICADDSSEVRRMREELSRISIVISQIENEVFTYRYRWTGIPSNEAEKEIDLSLLANLVAATKELALRCNECKDKPEQCRDC